MFQRFVSASFLIVLAVLPAAVMAEQGPADPVQAQQADAIKAQIKRLNAADTVEREDAEANLLKMGQIALPLLKDAANSQDPEVSARAKRILSKLAGGGAKPLTSYSDVLPANSAFIAEAHDFKNFRKKLQGSFLARIWELPEVQKYYTGYHDEQIATDQKALDAFREILRLVDGRLMIGMGPYQETKEPEIEPPLIYVAESSKISDLENQVRALFEGMNDATKDTRRYGPFTIDEQISAQTVFGQESIIHSLTAEGIESFLTRLIDRPAKPLTTGLAELRGLQPNYDVILHVNSEDFEKLAADGLMIDDEQNRWLSGMGFSKGSRLQTIVSLNAGGFEEFANLDIAEQKDAGILGVLKTVAAKPAPARDAAAPSALDMIPFQSGLLFSFQGDASANATALARAIRAVDVTTSPFNANPRPNANKAPDANPAVKPVAPEKKVDEALDKKDAKSRATEIIGDIAKDKPAAAEKDKPADPKAAKNDDEPDAERIARFEQMGLKLDQFLAHVDGPIHLALFFQHVDKEAPTDVPLSPLWAFTLKDAKEVEQALDAASAGDKPVFIKEVLNGGTHYVEATGPKESKPGFWLKGNYLAYSNERDLLDLAGMALAHRNGNERVADRAGYKQAVAASWLNPASIITIFGDADQVLEMPYALARINWGDEKNALPEYSLLKPMLQRKPVLVQVNARANGLQIHAQTPLTLIGVYEFFRRTFNASGY